MAKDTQQAARCSCYNCGKLCEEQFMAVRTEHRLATRYYEKQVHLCAACAEEWDERFPEYAAEEGNRDPSPEPAPAPEPLPEPQPQTLTKRQAERLAWYESMNKPLRGYSVRDAILRDDALGAEAHKASLLGLSYGQMMARRAEQKP